MKKIITSTILVLSIVSQVQAKVISEDIEFANHFYVD